MKTKTLSLLFLLVFFMTFCTSTQAQELWGMTFSGGNNSNNLNVGIIYSYNTVNNTLTKKMNFDYFANTGYYPTGGFLQANNGKLYATTNYGGANNLGALFEYDVSSDIITKKIDFDETNYGKFSDNLMQASDGFIYGLNNKGGTFGEGVLFKYDTSTGTMTKLYDFGDGGGVNGGFPIGKLIQAANGKLYGLTDTGGTYANGVLFEFDLNTNTYTVKIEFNTSTNGGHPHSLFKASNGKLYGFATDWSQGRTNYIFEFNTATDNFIEKIFFTTASSMGMDPSGDLIEVSSGIYYGITKSGGVNNLGTLFKYDFNTNNLDVKVNFNTGADGNTPTGSLFLDNNGKLYGTNSKGGFFGSTQTDWGVLFEYDIATNTYTKKIDFDSVNGSEPVGYLTKVTIPEVITLPDANLEQALIDLGYDTNGLSGNILKSEALAVTSLDVSDPITNPSLPNVSAKIADLTGISGFVNLQSLNVNNNSLSAINLSFNTNLTSLDVSNNLLTGLDVTNNTLLTSILANNNNMINIDISFNTNLTNLNLATNNLERANLKNTNNTAITTFDIRNNASLTCVLVDNPTWSNSNWVNHDSGATFSLDCNDTWTVYVPDSNLASNLLSISGIDLNHDNIITPNEAAAFTGLLDLSGSGITDPTGLEAFTGISELNLNNNNITDLTSLINSGVIVIASRIKGNKAYKTRNFNGLTALNINHNQLTSLDVSTLTSLVSLDVSYNNLTDLNIKNGNNFNLVNLNALSNSLSCIDADSNIIGFIPLGWQVDSSVNFSADCAATLYVESNFLNNQISIYPNPSQGLIYIDKTLDIKTNKLSLYNIVGGLVKQFKPSQTELQISELPTGLYLLKIETDKGNISKKIFKK